jgi:hypothetical protein
MGIKLDISVETPLSDDDRDILAGISVMVLAIANRQNLADQPFCVNEPGHAGRHKYRRIARMH